MKIFTTFCCAALALCSAIYAQSSNDRITVHFNSPVIVGETRLPAGDCDIQVVRGASNNTILVFRSEGTSAAAVVSRISDFPQDPDGNSSVVLSRHGNDLHIQRVLFADRVGYQLNSAE